MIRIGIVRRLRRICATILEKLLGRPFLYISGQSIRPILGHAPWTRSNNKGEDTWTKPAPLDYIYNFHVLTHSQVIKTIS